MSIELPDRAVRNYLAAFNLAAVFILAPNADTPANSKTFRISCLLGAGRALPANRRLVGARLIENALVLERAAARDGPAERQARRRHGRRPAGGFQPRIPARPY